MLILKRECPQHKGASEKKSNFSLPSHGSWFYSDVTVSIRRLTVPEFSVNCPEFVEIYISAMGYDPAIRDSRINAWRRETQQPGFTAVCAVEHGEFLGIAYGFLGSPDHWWHLQLRRGIHQKGGPSESEYELLRNYFEVAEIHVRVGHQGRGIGRALLTELLRNAPAGNAVLSTPEVPQESNLAFGLYRSLGFRDVLRNFHFTGDRRPFAILATHLPLPLATSASRVEPQVNRPGEEHP